MSKEPLYVERAPRAAKPVAAPAVPLSRPLWFDFFLIMLGCALSHFLADWSRFVALPSDTPGETPESVKELLLPSLPRLLFLPLGVLLFWPIFYLTQRLAGRKQALSAGEWLWGVAWLGAVLLSVWIVWQRWGPNSLPGFLDPENCRRTIFVSYVVGSMALAAVALLIGLIDLIGRWGQPWTHHCCLALVMWPLVPLAVGLLWHVKPG
ncbi:MAG TPA: hypothetical protein VEL76_04790 [Gemmataceae bacterium]|nr:hypothetical protein [Gemmataceae bacterium]